MKQGTGVPGSGPYHVAVGDEPNTAQNAALPTSMIFIDGTNLDRTCAEAFGRNDIDFEKLLGALASGTRLLGACYVTAPYLRELDEMAYRRQTGMINHLRRIPNVVVDLQQHRKRQFVCPKCGRSMSLTREKGTDVAVASHLVATAVARGAQRLVLVANDTDYAPALKIARSHGAHCSIAVVLAPTAKPHELKLNLAPLYNNANAVIVMEQQFMNACWMKGPAPSPAVQTK